MNGVQLFATAFVAWMVYFSFLHYRRKEFSIWEFLFWQFLWLGILFVVIFPKTVNFLLSSLSINRAFDFLTIVSITILFGLAFRNYVLLRRTQRKLIELVRHLAIAERKDTDPSE